MYRDIDFTKINIITIDYRLKPDNIEIISLSLYKEEALKRDKYAHLLQLYN